MKAKIITTVFFMILFSELALGQTPIKLSFTGVDNFQHVPLNRIDVRNLDKLCDTTLFWPDTTLSSNTLGITDLFSNGNLRVFQNSPNPVEERTSIKILIPEKGNVRIQISDLLGRVVTSQNQELGRGSHVFIFTPGNKQVYLFTAIYKNESSTIKIVATTKSASNEGSLLYQGIESENTIIKSSYSSEKFLFSPGDSLEMTGYYSDFSSILNDNPATSKTYTFTFSSNSPIVSTSPVTNILLNTATCGGNVTSEGGTPVTAKGVCWSTSSNPTINNNKTVDGVGLGEFTSSMIGLLANTSYYVRAYAVNNAGISYGLQQEFTTLSEITIPSLITTPLSNISNISAQSGGTITSDGGSAVLAKGVCWSTNVNPTISGSHTIDGTGSGNFTSQLTNLSPVTFYYVRSYATNSAGTAYGNQLTFSTLENPIVPAVTTAQVANITTTNATCGGNVVFDGGSPVTVRGVCWSLIPDPTIADNKTEDGSGVGEFISNLSGLTPSTAYYIRAYATNSVGTAYGNSVSFTTLSNPISPTVSTTAVTNIDTTSATSGGNVTSDGGSPVTTRGVCWNTSSNPTTANSHTADGSGTGVFVSNLPGLTPSTLYYARAYATNSVGTAYGNEVSFTTLTTWSCGNSITINHDAGSVAPVTKTVTYGTVTNIPGETPKCWITSNLGADHQATAVDDATEASAGWYWQFNRKQGFKHDGTTRTPNTTWITSISENTDWTTSNDPCSIELGSDWRIPTNSEWTNVNANGNWTDWNGPWSSGLKLHSSGYLNNSDGSLGTRGIEGYYRSSSQYGDGNGLSLFFNSGASYMYYYNKAYGFSLRCLRGSPNPSLPTVTTTAASNISQTSATSGGNVTSDGGAPVTTRGVCWSTSTNPTIINSHTSDGSGLGSFVSNLTGLTANTLYYLRSYSTNSVGTAYGNEISFTTIASPFSCGDIVSYEGKNYNTIQIGTQCWFKENLNVGTKINGSQAQTNNGLKEKYCYNDLESNCNIYGGLYQWDEMMQYTTTAGTQGLCPSGWHPPTSTEWNTLISLLGGDVVAGGKMKENGTNHWDPPNTGATNESGFTAFGAGKRDNSSFNTLKLTTCFWEEQFTSEIGYMRYLGFNTTECTKFGASKNFSLSVRCMKN